MGRCFLVDGSRVPFSRAGAETGLPGCDNRRGLIDRPRNHKQIANDLVVVFSPNFGVRCDLSSWVLLGFKTMPAPPPTPCFSPMSRIQSSVQEAVCFLSSVYLGGLKYCQLLRMFVISIIFRGLG